MMKICICGGGNLGHVCAGFLSAQPDVEVNLLTTHPDLWNSTIEIDDPDGKTYHGHLSCISSVPAEAQGREGLISKRFVVVAIV